MIIVGQNYLALLLASSLQSNKLAPNEGAREKNLKAKIQFNQYTYKKITETVASYSRKPGLIAQFERNKEWNTSWTGVSEPEGKKHPSLFQIRTVLIYKITRRMSVFSCIIQFS